MAIAPLLAASGPPRHLDVLPDRPRTRGDCVDGPRPCPWVGCSMHLYAWVDAHGVLHPEVAGVEPWEMAETCALDVADRGPTERERVGELLGGKTGERVRQVSAEAAAKLRGNEEARALYDAMAPSDAESPADRLDGEPGSPREPARVGHEAEAAALLLEAEAFAGRAAAWMGAGVRWRKAWLLAGGTDPSEAEIDDEGETMGPTTQTTTNGTTNGAPHRAPAPAPPAAEMTDEQLLAAKRQLEEKIVARIASREAAIAAQQRELAELRLALMPPMPGLRSRPSRRTPGPAKARPRPRSAKEAPASSKYARVLADLEANPESTAREISERLGGDMDAKTVRNAMTYFKGQGKVRGKVQDGRTRWTVAT